MPEVYPMLSSLINGQDVIVNLANVLARAIGNGNPLESPDELEKSPARGYLFPGDSDLTPIVDEVH
jgi:hypothetical protein